MPKLPETTSLDCGIYKASHIVYYYLVKKRLLGRLLSKDPLMQYALLLAKPLLKRNTGENIKKDPLTQKNALLAKQLLKRHTGENILNEINV